MRGNIFNRLERLEASQAEHGQEWHRHILIETHHLSLAARDQRIAEVDAAKQPGDLLIIVDRVRDLSYLEGYEHEASVYQAH